MVITVTCPSCSASFPVDTHKIPAAGVNARCSSCRHVFRIERPVEPPAPPPAPPEPAWEPPPEPAYEPPEPAYEAPPPPVTESPEPEPAFAEPVFEAPPSFDDTPAFPEPAAAGTDFTVEAGETEAPAPSQEWVFEQEERIDPGSLDIQPMEAAEPAPFAPPPLEEEPPPPPPPTPPPPPEPAPHGVGGFTFGKRDPTDKARRLARVLVSDMIMYNPKRHEQALANGTLKEDFEDEIAKSWKEYVEQVGEEMATQNPFWADALNDVLARGQRIF